ncbi:DUF4296 domain-containing protein [Chryseobacterium sp. T1]
MYRYLIIIVLILASCSKFIEKPKNLLTEDQMAEIIAEFAIADQSFVIDANITQQESSRFILKKFKIKGQTFTDSYQYYLVESKLDDIFDKAQKVILTKDPKLEAYIKKKTQENLPKPEQKTP